MALLLKKLVEWYLHARDDLKDPRTDNWFLVHSPVTVLFIGCTYIFLVTEWLPKLMQNRQPFDLRRVIVVYNLVQIALNAYIICEGLPSLHTLNLTSCSPVDYSYDHHAMVFARLTWLYFMVKFMDLLDTVFFVLRKNSHQVSFLHVYHHFGMFIVAWVGTKYVAGGESIYLGMVNSVVHMFMYGYYTYSAWRPEKRESVMGWKKLVTQLQLFQFILLFVLYFPKLFIECSFSKVLLGLFVPQNMAMIAMFGEFYYRAYVRTPRINAN